jgi:hypothetical protein
MRSVIDIFAALAKPESMYPNIDALRSTPPSASGGPAQNSTGRSYYGFALVGMIFGAYSAARATPSRGGAQI